MALDPETLPIWRERAGTRNLAMHAIYRARLEARSTVSA
jgi:hypothetical protein